MLDRAGGLRMMARPGGQLAITEAAQLAAQGLRRDADLEPLPKPLAEIDQAPAHDAMHRRRRTALDRIGQRRPVGVVEPRWLAGRFTIDQAVRAVRVELQHPVPNDLQRHATDPGGIGPARPLVDRRQRQQTPGLRRILRSPRYRTQANSVEINPKRNRHGELPCPPS
jgi:hypothetical protein